MVALNASSGLSGAFTGLSSSRERRRHVVLRLIPSIRYCKGSHVLNAFSVLSTFSRIFYFNLVWGDRFFEISCNRRRCSHRHTGPLQDCFFGKRRHSLLSCRDESKL